jgi:hypothetical protein
MPGAPNTAINGSSLAASGLSSKRTLISQGVGVLNPQDPPGVHSVVGHLRPISSSKNSTGGGA